MPRSRAEEKPWLRDTAHPCGGRGTWLKEQAAVDHFELVKLIKLLGGKYKKAMDGSREKNNDKGRKRNNDKYIYMW